MMTSKVVVTLEDPGSLVGLKGIEFLLDGKSIEFLQFGENKEFEILAGEHTAKVILHGVVKRSSKELKFSLREGQILCIEAKYSRTWGNMSIGLARELPFTISDSNKFLAMLTQEEKIAVSNLSPMIYAAIIGEKKGNMFDFITDDTNTERAVPMLRKLEITDLEKLLEAVETCIKADQAANQRNLAEAAKLYRKTIEINKYHDLALMSYGTSLAMQGNLRDGIKWVERAILVNPKNDRARNNLQAMKAKL